MGIMAVMIQGVFSEVHLDSYTEIQEGQAHHHLRKAEFLVGLSGGWATACNLISDVNLPGFHCLGNSCVLISWLEPLIN